MVPHHSDRDHRFVVPHHTTGKDHSFRIKAFVLVSLLLVGGKRMCQLANALMLLPASLPRLLQLIMLVLGATSGEVEVA